MSRRDILNNVHKVTKELEALASSFTQISSIPNPLIDLFEERLIELVELSETLRMDNSKSNVEEVKTVEKVKVVEEPKKVEVEKKVEVVEKIDIVESEKKLEFVGLTPISNFKDAISINDRFLFLRELFNDNSELYDNTIERLDVMSSYSEVNAYIKSKFKWDKDSEVYLLFDSILRRRFA